jgi:hypothetical protein
MKTLTHSLLIAAAALAMPVLLADDIVLKNGEKFDGKIQGLKDGQLQVLVFADYVAGIPAYKRMQVRFSTIRSIAFDGRDDFYSIVKKNDELVFAHVREFSKGKFVLDKHDPVPLAAVKALVPSKPDQKEAE